MSGSVVTTLESPDLYLSSQPQSLGLRWGTREAVFRKRLHAMTKSQNEISLVYKELLRSMISSFNDVEYIDSENKLTQIKSFHANPERAIAKLMQEDNIILPVITVSQTISDNDDKRRRYESVLVHEKYWDQEKHRAFRVLSFAPRPVNIRYQVNIWTKYMADMDQILEQIRLKFNPEMELHTPFSNLVKGYIDSEDDTGSVTAGDKEARVLKKAINITVRTYIPNPKFLITSTGKIEKFINDISFIKC